MSNPSPKQVSISFIAQNADEFQAKLDKILVLYGKLSRQLPEVQSAIKNSGLSLEQQQHALDLVAQSATESAKAIDKLSTTQVLSNKLIGETTKTLREQAQAQSLAASAVKTPTTQAEQTDLLKQKAEQDAYARGQKLLDLRIRQAIAERDYAKALQLNAQAQLESAGNEQRLIQLRTQEANISRTANASPITSYGRELGAFLSVAFALNSTIDLISRSLSGKLTPAAREAADAVRIISDTALLGLSTAGIPGAAIGALGGAIGALGIMALKTDPTIQALNDTLDKLGKKDDAAQGLAKLANISDKNAQAALDYLKANDQLAASFQQLSQNAQAPIPVLQGAGDAIRGLGDALGALGGALDAIVPQRVAFKKGLEELPAALQGDIEFVKAFRIALQEGKSVSEAYAAGIEAIGKVARGTIDAQKQLASTADAYATVQNEINRTTALNAVQNAQATIDKLRLEGASADELRAAYIKLAQAKIEAEKYPTSGVSVFPGAATARATGLQVEQQNDLSFLNATATKLYKDLAALQRDYNNQSEQLAIDHTSRLDEIASSAYERQIRLEREFNQRRVEIQQRYDQDVADAGSDYAQRVADAEANTQERRKQIASDYADRRAKIEQDYQDRVAKILSDYQDSLFDIEARGDAKGLIRARLQRDKQLADAQKTRERENADNDKQKAKQEKDLQEALDRQKKQLEQEYQRRLRDLKQQFDRENASNQQNYRDQLADLNDATAKQYAAENEAYRKSQAALDKSNAEKKQALIDALTDIKGITQEYAQAIIDSLKSILDPQTIIQLTNDLQKALDTKIEIKVTPNASTVPTLPPNPDVGPTQFAMGGYNPVTQRALVHAGETVLPTDPQRAYRLAEEHLRRLSLPANRVSLAMGASGYATPQSGKVYIYVDNSLNNAMLSSQIRTEAIGVTAEVIRRSTKAY